jgi:3-phosphoshikimate 1-carboxyvinyltransferase
VSSQYLTALLMAAPLAKGTEGVNIKITDELVSQPYVDMTIRLMERFGVKVSNFVCLTLPLRDRCMLRG